MPRRNSNTEDRRRGVLRLHRNVEPPKPDRWVADQKMIAVYPECFCDDIKIVTSDRGRSFRLHSPRCWRVWVK